MDNKAIRLVEYLIRITDLQRRIIMNIEDYQQVMWLDDIPRLKGCFARAWDRTSKFDESVWIEVQGRREPSLPNPPNACLDWIDPEALQIKSEIPLPNETLNQQIDNPDWDREDGDQPQFLYGVKRLEDHPSVERQWERYVLEQWIPWTEEHNEWASVHKVYSRLFTIHQEQLKLGEEYELIVGIGLLNWTTPDNQRVRRHVLVSNAVLEFDTALRRFTVRPNLDGADLRLELEMIESSRPPNIEEIVKRSLSIADDNPWEYDAIDDTLRGIIHSIDPNGEYHDRLRPETPTIMTKAVLEYAPALILRKRSVRGLTDTLRTIKAQLQADEPIIPTEFCDLAEMKQSLRSEADGQAHDCVLHPQKEQGDIYFPKPANGEQRRIAELINRTDSVLVQGPPGTGKSHTIANLICHLLAHGKRILVTAKTPRALRVIEALLPEEVKPLCVNLLGTGAEERTALENSMGAILSKTQDWQEKESQRTEERLEQSLLDLREEKAVIENRLRHIREAETYYHIIVDGRYRGTAASIAREVQDRVAQYSWWVDNVDRKSVV